MQALQQAQKEAAVKSFTSTLLSRGFYGQALGTQVTNYAATLGLTQLPADVKAAIVMSATRPAAAMAAAAAPSAASAAGYAVPARVAAPAPAPAAAFLQQVQAHAQLDQLRALEQARRAAAAQPAVSVSVLAARAEPAVSAHSAAPAAKKQKKQAAAAAAAAYPAPIPAAVAAAAAADGADQMMELEGDQDQAAVSWEGKCSGCWAGNGRARAGQAAMTLGGGSGLAYGLAAWA